MNTYIHTSERRGERKLGHKQWRRIDLQLDFLIAIKDDKCVMLQRNGTKKIEKILYIRIVIILIIRSGIRLEENVRNKINFF